MKHKKSEEEKHHINEMMIKFKAHCAELEEEIRHLKSKCHDLEVTVEEWE